MKKFFAIMVALFLMIIVSACGNEAAENEQKNGQEIAATEVKHDDDDHADGPHEPGADDVCAFCNMKVYEKADPMGVFTAQAKTKDGEYVFFDDSGCLLNITRRDDIEFEEKWVRDYITSEWVEADSATPVKADLKTPMKYGYAFFKHNESAEKFISENSDKNPAMATWEQIDQIANERYMKKMKMNSDSMDKDKDSEMDGDSEEESGL
ncbi:nitrous oxide reductase accessory protein NosL [Mesobacillus selenatarsenatis]|uniref:NosL protein n=1 Tax=Mesobacillus selenatarsenatis (strain DSM 18680 / JCM 14380 / FERM P-15431 / SF-1) TaxID=1321606 RepID=A0A0A8XAP5_MESS1|nr:nitrous oxide reductase accessory protein NosL [Mesobacillus selenatarsenatis]GAM16112.1 NosL protein [Mesobacillus selenatarsenatis SF-1]